MNNTETMPVPVEGEVTNPENELSPEEKERKIQKEISDYLAEVRRGVENNGDLTPDEREKKLSKLEKYERQTQNAEYFSVSVRDDYTGDMFLSDSVYSYLERVLRNLNGKIAETANQLGADKGISEKDRMELTEIKEAELAEAKRIKGMLDALDEDERSGNSIRGKFRKEKRDTLKEQFEKQLIIEGKIKTEAEHILGEEIIKEILNNPDVVQETELGRKKEKVAYHLSQKLWGKGIVIKAIEKRYGRFNEQSNRAYVTWDWTLAEELLAREELLREKWESSSYQIHAENLPDSAQSESDEPGSDEGERNKGNVGARMTSGMSSGGGKDGGNKGYQQGERNEGESKLPKKEEYIIPELDELIEKNKKSLTEAEQLLKYAEAEVGNRGELNPDFDKSLGGLLESARTVFKIAKRKLDLSETFVINLKRSYQAIDNNADRLILNFESDSNSKKAGIKMKIEKIKSEFAKHGDKEQNNFDREISGLVGNSFEYWGEKKPFKKKNELFVIDDFIERVSFYQNKLSDTEKKRKELELRNIIGASEEELLSKILEYEKLLRKKIAALEDEKKYLLENQEDFQKNYEEKIFVSKKDEEHILRDLQEKIFALEYEAQKGKKGFLTGAERDKQKLKEHTLDEIRVLHERLDQRSKTVNELLNTLDTL